jgi:hypothetical protein
MLKGLVVGIGLLALGGSWTPSFAADADIGVAPRQPRHYASSCPRVWTCRDGACDWQHVCRPVACPDGYGCYPLYGAYGPYGGTAFWSSFSYKY